MGGNFEATATAGKEKHTKVTKKGEKKFPSNFGKRLTT